MFGKPVVSEKVKRDYFSTAAARFAMDAKMLRCRASVHVENKDDILFWERVLRHYIPKDKFHFISGSRNEFGHETCGVTQCLKYKPYLSPSFVICIDSDYRHLQGEAKIDAKHFVIQTYTYSFENHLCFAHNLTTVCKRLTNLENCYFNFALFWRCYSNILYDLFVWHLYLLDCDEGEFLQNDFNRYLSLKPYGGAKRAATEPEEILSELGESVAVRVAELERTHPDADIDAFREKLWKRGLTEDNVYLLVRGHNIYDLTIPLCREVCRRMLRAARRPLHVLDNLEHVMMETIYFDGYPEMDAVAADLEAIFGEG